MMLESHDPDWFSLRSKVRPSPERLIQNDVPGEFGKRLGVSFSNLCARLGRVGEEDNFVETLYEQVSQIPTVRQTYAMPGDEVWVDKDAVIYKKGQLRKIFDLVPWYASLDVSEAIDKVLSDLEKDAGEHSWEQDKALVWRSEREKWGTDVNDLFAEFGLAWTFRNGRIERLFPPPLDKSVEETTWYLKRNKRYRGPDLQFVKALRHLNQKPEPDTANAIKDAVGALEAVARIIVDDPKVVLGDALKHKEPLKSGLHGAVKESLVKIYAYRGDAPGVGHGLVGPETPSLADAEFVVGTCAAGILLLYKKFVIGQAETP